MLECCADKLKLPIGSFKCNPFHSISRAAYSGNGPDKLVAVPNFLSTQRDCRSGARLSVFSRLGHHNRWAFTPTGRLTESSTISLAALPRIFQDETIIPFGERNFPPTDLGSTLSWTCGARATFANPGFAGVRPNRCFHIRCPMPPQRKIWFIVP